MIWLLLVPVLSWLDRQRGMPKDVETIPKLPALLGIGYVCSVLTGHWMDWQALVITLSVAVIHNFSFGNPLGTALTGVVSVAPDGTLHEKWQVGNLLKSNPWVALGRTPRHGLHGGSQDCVGVGHCFPVVAVPRSLRPENASQDDWTVRKGVGD